MIPAITFGDLLGAIKVLTVFEDLLGRPMNLTPNEIRALRWLERAFPMIPVPEYVDWATVANGLSTEAGVTDETAAEAIIESLRRRDLFEGGRAAQGKFRGSITHRGQDVIRELDAQDVARRAQGSLFKRFARYLVTQSGPLVVQAIVGVLIGALIGWITGTLQSALVTGVASATAAGRVPQFRPQ